MSLAPGDTVAILAAAGAGIRLGLGPKAFLRLAGVSLLRMALARLAPYAGRVRVAVPAGMMQQARREAEGIKATFELIEGGSSSQETLCKLFAGCSESIVVIDEITRPFTSAEVMQRVVDAVDKTGAVVPAIPSHVPVMLHQDNRLIDAMSKDQALMPQTPQAYHASVLDVAFTHARKENIEKQTTWQLVQSAGIPITLVAGDEQNIKITTPFDWQVAQAIHG